MGLPRLERHERYQLQDIAKLLTDAYSGRPDHDAFCDALLGFAHCVESELRNDPEEWARGMRRFRRLVQWRPKHGQEIRPR